MLKLGKGAQLIIPAHTISNGAIVRGTYRAQPAGKWGHQSPTFAPIHLTVTPAGAIHGVLRLQYPVPAGHLPAGISPAVAYGISTLASGRWASYPSRYDSATHSIIAEIRHFSWWAPWTWDWDQLWADVTQGFGQLVGARSGPARCSGPPPSWVNQLAGVSNDADVAIHTCGQAQGDILDLQIQNNRPYSQILTYGGPVKWGWHEKGNSVEDAARDALMNKLMPSNELYIPALGAASVGIFPLAPGSDTTWHIGPTEATIATDLFTYLVGTAAVDLLGKINVVDCASHIIDMPLKDTSPGNLRALLLVFADCVKGIYLGQVASGGLDQTPVNQLAGELDMIRKGTVLLDAIQLVGGLTWKIGDLAADWTVNSSSSLGNGFSVLAHSATPPAQTTQPATTQAPLPTTHASAQPPPETSANPPPPTRPASRPVNAYDNYGSANAGRAMCRGNPGRPESMPGGTATQTFTVGSGVSSLSGMEVQIDPDSTVTAHLTVSVNGASQASADATAAGDTHFSFGPVAVIAGESVGVSISFTATDGKIITVYTAGSAGGTFTASNSCSDGAPNVSTTSTGLRAVVSGMS